MEALLSPEQYRPDESSVMADNRLRLLVFREWENGAPKKNAKGYDRECKVDEIESHRIEAKALGYELEAVMIEGSEGWY